MQLVREGFRAARRVMIRDEHRILDFQRQAEMDRVRIEELEVHMARNEQNSIVIEQAKRIRMAQLQGGSGVPC